MNSTRRLPTPQYQQVKNHLRDGIVSGRWSPGDLMPSEAELVLQFGVSRMTVNRALRDLVEAGLVERVQGVGTFVAQLHRIASTLTVRDLHEEILERGHQHEARIELVQRIKATPEQAQQFGLASGAPLFHTLMVHLENGVAIQCEDRLVNPAVVPDYLKTDFTQITPTHYLLSAVPLSMASYTIESTLPTGQEAQLLGISKREPCLVVRRRTSSRGQTVTVVRLVHPGSRYVIEGTFQP